MPEEIAPNDITGVDNSKLMAALSYVGFLVLVPLFMYLKDPFVKFHAKQGVVILAGEVLAVFAVAWVPVVGNLLFIILFITSVLGLIQALQGKRWKIPGIGDLADKFNV